MKGKKLHKSKENRMIFGVCGGIAEYLNIDPSFVRILWVFLSFVYGSGIIAYIIVALILPTESKGK